MITIPDGFRPPCDINLVQQGSGSNRYLTTFQKDGKVHAARYSDNATMNNSVPVNSWLDLFGWWIID